MLLHEIFALNNQIAESKKKDPFISKKSGNYPIYKLSRASGY